MHLKIYLHTFYFFYIWIYILIYLSIHPFSTAYSRVGLRGQQTQQADPEFPLTRNIFQLICRVHTISVAKLREGRGLSVSRLRIKRYQFVHPPRNNLPLVLLYTCWGHLTNVRTSKALVFGFISSSVDSHSSGTFNDEVNCYVFQRYESATSQRVIMFITLLFSLFWFNSGGTAMMSGATQELIGPSCKMIASKLKYFD